MSSPRPWSAACTDGGRPQILAPGEPSKSIHDVADQWDGVTEKGDFFKGGFGGQFLDVARART